MLMAVYCEQTGLLHERELVNLARDLKSMEPDGDALRFFRGQYICALDNLESDREEFDRKVRRIFLQ